MNWAVSAVLPTPDAPSMTTRSGSPASAAGLAASAPGPTVHCDPRLEAPSADPAPVGDDPFSPLSRNVHGRVTQRFPGLVDSAIRRQTEALAAVAAREPALRACKRRPIDSCTLDNRYTHKGGPAFLARGTKGVVTRQSQRLGSIGARPAIDAPKESRRRRVSLAPCLPRSRSRRSLPNFTLGTRGRVARIEMQNDGPAEIPRPESSGVVRSRPAPLMTSSLTGVALGAQTRPRRAGRDSAGGRDAGARPSACASQSIRRASRFPRRVSPPASIPCFNFSPSTSSGATLLIRRRRRARLRAPGGRGP